MSVTIADNVRDLLDKPIVVAIATVNPDGQPQVTPVWASLEGDQLWINSAVGRRKDRNLRANPKVTVMVLDPANDFNWAELRGEVVEFDESAAALAHINKLSGIYAGNEDYYSFNPEGRGKEQRVIYKIELSKINSM